MRMGRQSGYLEGKSSAQPDPTARLAEALLGSHVSARSESLLMIKFDEPRDLKIANRTLLQLRDSYRAPRD
jgi:hypothetical protein